MRIVVMSTRMVKKKTGFQTKNFLIKKNQASDNKKRCMFYSDISKTIMHWQLQYCKIHTRNENKRQEKARCAQAHATSHSTTTHKKKRSQLTAHLLLPRVVNHALLNLSLLTCHAMLGGDHFYCRQLWHSITRRI